jgi:hypothetical protein
VVGVEIEQTIDVPATVGWELGDPVDAVVNQPPQLLRRRHSAGQPARHSHNRDRLVGLRIDFTQPLIALPQIGEHALEILAKLLVIRHGKFVPSC